MTNTVTYTVNIKPLFYLGVLLIILKLTPVMDWPWGVVLIPMYPFIAIYAFAIIMIVLVALSPRTKWVRR